MEILSKNLNQTLEMAEQFVKKLLKYKDNSRKMAQVVALYGDLGSGKTSFVQGCAKTIGISNTIISPTFVIERIYKISADSFTHFIHIDCYRIEDEKEIENLGWNEIINNPKNIIFSEWASKIEKILPKNTIKIYFEFESENTRKIDFKDITI